MTGLETIQFNINIKAITTTTTTTTTTTIYNDISTLVVKLLFVRLSMTSQATRTSYETPLDILAHLNTATHMPRLG